MLDVTPRAWEAVRYVDAYIVLDPGSSDLVKVELLEEERYREMTGQFPDLRAGMGAEAVRELLKAIDLETLSCTLFTDMREVGSEARRTKVVKRLKMVEALRQSGNAAA